MEKQPKTAESEHTRTMSRVELMHKSARFYAQLGFKVLPLQKGSKVPNGLITPHGFKNATNDLTKIDEWFSKEEYNIGIVTGYDSTKGWGILVIDFDSRSGGDPNSFPFPLPPTLVVESGGGGGWHYYYIINKKVKTMHFGNGVDIKGAGGYIVAPPSIVNKKYKIVSGSFQAIAEAPEWVYDSFDFSEKAPNEDKIPEGRRHNAVLKETVRRKRAGFQGERLTNAIHKFNEERCAPPLTEKEVNAIIIWAEKNIKVSKNQSTEIKKEIAMDLIAELEWCMYRNRKHYIVRNRRLIAPIESIGEYLTNMGLNIGKDKAQEWANGALFGYHLDDFKGLVLGNTFTYAEVGEYKGLWGYRKGVLALITPDGVKKFSKENWPDGVFVYYNSGIPYDIGADFSSIEPLKEYFTLLGARLGMDWRIALSMLLPALFGQGQAGFLFAGPAGSGKSTFARGLAYLQRGKPWATPVGNNIRDHLAVLANNNIIYFDDQTYLNHELQTMLKTLVTKGEIEARQYYDAWQTATRELYGSVIIATTGIKGLMADLVDRFFYITFVKKENNVNESYIETFFKNNWEKAWQGAISLYQQAAKVEVPQGILPTIRFRDWLGWAYRYAVILGVEDELIKHIKMAKLAVFKTLKYGFIVEALLNENFKPGKYRFGDLVRLAGEDENDVHYIALSKGLKGESARREIETIANAMGYEVSFEKMYTEKGKPRLYIVFTSMEDSEEQESNYNDVPF